MFLVPIFLSGLCDRERMCTANNHHATFLSGLCDREQTALAAARAAAGKSAAAAASLRGQLDTARGRLAEADAATCADYATAASAVFSECVARYRSVAEAADGHAADATALMNF